MQLQFNGFGSRGEASCLRSNKGDAFAAIWTPVPHEKDVLAIYGLASLEEKIALLQSLKAGDVATVVSKAESFVAGGIDVRRLVSDLISILKDLLIYEKTGDASLIEDLSEEQAQLLSKSIGPSSCNEMIALLLAAQNDFKNVSDVRSLFELTLLRIASLATPEEEGSIHSPVKATERVKKETKSVGQPKPIEQPKIVEQPKPVEPAPDKKEAVPEVKVAVEENKSPQTPGETTPPDFLFEDDKPIENKPIEKKVEAKTPSKEEATKMEPAPAPSLRETTTINISNIFKPAIAIEGMQFELPDEEIIKIMSIARELNYVGPSPLLYLVATPIGNLGEFPPRAIEVLKQMDFVACEDTRNSGLLLQRFSIDKPLISCHEHNEESASDKIIALLKNGKKVAYVSDAGYPVVSDPGNRLAKRCVEEGIKVAVVNGPSAGLCALVGSGLPADHFFFYGFLPAKQSERRNELRALKALDCTIIFYESPHRIKAMLVDVSAILGSERPACLCRELTKTHEEYIHAKRRQLRPNCHLIF